jgi:hypothetical protein
MNHVPSTIILTEPLVLLWRHILDVNGLLTHFCKNDFVDLLVLLIHGKSWSVPLLHHFPELGRIVIYFLILKGCRTETFILLR